MAKDEDFATTVGAGGETHQHVPRQGPHDPDAHLTTNQGIRVSDNQNSLKAGEARPEHRRASGDREHECRREDHASGKVPHRQPDHVVGG